MIITICNGDAKFLGKCIYSIMGQFYNNWELCVVAHESTKMHIKPILEKLGREDSRVKIRFLKENQGIAEAANKAVSLATGEFLGFLHPNDELTTDALYEVAKALNSNDIDIIYSDEVTVNSKGLLHDTYYKPDFSPDLCFHTII